MLIDKCNQLTESPLSDTTVVSGSVSSGQILPLVSSLHHVQLLGGELQHERAELSHVYISPPGVLGGTLAVHPIYHHGHTHQQESTFHPANNSYKEICTCTLTL